MKNSLSFKLCAISLSTAVLASCGGGGSSTSQVDANASANTAAAATFADCFKLTPGVKFVKSNGYKELIVQEAFEGQTAIGMMELRADDTRFGGSYLAVDANYVQILGTIDYNVSGVYDGKEVYSGYRVLANLAPGQSVTINYTNTATRLSPTTTTTTTAETNQMTFAGFEDLTLAGRTFTNTCKTKSPSSSSTTGEMWVSWFAKDFGVIRREKQDAQGATVANTRVELATIVKAP